MTPQSEQAIYSCLDEADKFLTADQISKQVQLSAITVRQYLRDMVGKQLVVRKTIGKNSFNFGDQKSRRTMRLTVYKVRRTTECPPKKHSITGN